MKKILHAYQTQKASEVWHKANSLILYLHRLDRVQLNPEPAFFRLKNYAIALSLLAHEFASNRKRSAGDGPAFGGTVRLAAIRLGGQAFLCYSAGGLQAEDYQRIRDWAECILESARDLEEPSRALNPG